jgi:putative two-component system response regulator
MTATVLVVDADAPNCANLKAILAGQGYDVKTAATGAEALMLCPILKPDLVLLNDELPDANGLEVCRQLKDDPRNRMTPVVMLSGGGNDSPGAPDGRADDVWGHAPTPWEALSRVQSLLRIKTYIDEQAESVIFSLSQCIEARDPYDGGHCARVSNNAVRFGKSLGLSQADLDVLRIGGLLHDIGKIGIPESILSKPGPLNSEEIAIMEQHTVLGEQICSPLKSLRHILPVIRHHHERLDGSGYPDGLRGDRIPLTARVLQIVDICDALTSDRAYRKIMSVPDALVVLYQEAERGWLDEELVTQFAPIAVGAAGVAGLGNQARFRSSEGPKWAGKAPGKSLNRNCC